MCLFIIEREVRVIKWEEMNFCGSAGGEGKMLRSQDRSQILGVLL